MSQSRKFLLIFGGVVFLLSAQHIVRFSTQPSDIWWTPRQLSLSLAEVSDRVEVYVRDAALLEQVKAGRIQVLTDAGATPIRESETRLRFNNWDRVRAQEIPALLASAACLGASAVLLLLGIAGWVPTRTARQAP